MQVLSNSNSTRRCTGLVLSILIWDEWRWIPDRQAGDITVYYIYTYTYTHTLQYIALHYITIHCIALHYITLHCIALHYITYIYIYMCVCVQFLLVTTWISCSGFLVRHLCPVPVAKLARLDGPDFCRGFVMKRFGWMVFFSPLGPLGP